MTCDRLHCDRPAAFEVRLDFAKGERESTKRERLCVEHTEVLKAWALSDDHVLAMFAEPIGQPQEHAA